MQYQSPSPTGRYDAAPTIYSDGAKRQKTSTGGHYPVVQYTSPQGSPPLPGLSSMLYHQRSPKDLKLSPRSPMDETMLSPVKRPLAAFSQGVHLGAQVSTPSTCSEDGPDPSYQLYQPGYLHPNQVPVETKPLIRTQVAATTAGSGAEDAAKPTGKSSRYLREIDRRDILSRIEQGEKQSALAKEYQVSRAAICNLNKHRDEVLSRKDGNPLAKHPKKPRPKSLKAKYGRSSWAMAGKDNTEDQEQNGVFEIKSRAAALLITTLRKKHTTVSEFRRSSDRLMRLVMEEALACVPVKTVEIFLTNQVKTDGVALEHPPCAISMEPAGCPMLDLFHLMEPEQPTGYVSFGDIPVSPADSRTLDVQVKVHDARLPPNLNYHNVFLVDHVVTSAELVGAVVRRLQERGAVESMISLVALMATAEAVEKLRAAFPALKIVVAQVDQGTEELSALSAGFGASQAGATTTDMILDRLEQVYYGYMPPANAY
ncbi:hypothetical protein PHYBOEH_007425 [Phytophthora boehmeriae]|uniref:Phosphoribosyltransferase domain-containing protein n=1 Tax=Phytophthora boehmeriae TaxID=109152 RepID=A0A8T1WBG5_9STRA|nr:hypothetical protein PHYBOEH_007425 [Phytophthora boehmeriae]